MSHGGKRDGSGRKPSLNPRIARSIKFTDEEWETLKLKANENNLTISDYIRKKALE